tara:strand:- start:387 stop:1661 length:1275 start_codon:yes stop_codon:yes gene_type:complete
MSTIKLADLLKESYSRLFEDDREDAVVALTKAFKEGPAATRWFLDTDLGQSAVVRDDILMSPELDGSTTDDKVDISTAGGAAKDYLPTQSEIDLMKSVSWPLGSAATLLDAINSGPIAAGIVVSGNLVIDGHHRWSGAYAIGKDSAKIAGKDISWPGASTAEKLAAAQLAIAAKLGAGKTTPTQPDKFDTNIMGLGADAISEMIMANINKKTDPNAPGPLLNDKMVETITQKPDEYKAIFEWLGSAPISDIYKFRLAVANKIGENLSSLPSNDEAPEREDMPQFDTKVGGPELASIEPDIKGAKYNLEPPFGESVISRNYQHKKMKTIQQQLKEAITPQVNESYASSFGGSRNVDWEMVQDALNREGYDTPYKGIWDQIMVEKNGVRVGKIDKSGNHYFVYPNGVYNNTTYKWVGLDGFLKQID